MANFCPHPSIQIFYSTRKGGCITSGISVGGGPLMKSLSKAESLIVGEFKVFEMTSPAVDGTKPFISGPLYTDLIEENLSTSIRIAREIKLKVQKEHLNKIAL